MPDDMEYQGTNAQIPHKKQIPLPHRKKYQTQGEHELSDLPQVYIWLLPTCHKNSGDSPQLNCNMWCKYHLDGAKHFYSPASVLLNAAKTLTEEFKPPKYSL